VRVVGSHRDGAVVLLAFTGMEAWFRGAPNGEAFEGHPLTDSGCAVVRVPHRRIVMIRRLERMNSVHHDHRPDGYSNLHHVVRVRRLDVRVCRRRFSATQVDGLLASAALEVARAVQSARRQAGTRAGG
jgi:hypothetical protein